jgi:hypothetical protein
MNALKEDLYFEICSLCQRHQIKQEEMDWARGTYAGEQKYILGFGKEH